jgi:hypothetical protein
MNFSLSLLIVQTQQTSNEMLASSTLVHRRFSVYVGRRAPSFVSSFHSASVYFSLLHDTLDRAHYARGVTIQFLYNTPFLSFPLTIA